MKFTRTTFIGRLTRCSVLSMVISGCADAPMFDRAEGSETLDADDSSAAPEVDVAEVVAMAESYRTALVPMTDTPEYSETHSDAASVLVWGTQANAALFHSIDPRDPTQFLTFPNGTLFVKEQFDEAGNPNALTAMYKAPVGYNPDGHDWFWLRIYEGEVTAEGKVPLCMRCHEAAQNSDFVVGFSKSQ